MPATHAAVTAEQTTNVKKFVAMAERKHDINPRNGAKKKTVRRPNL